MIDVSIGLPVGSGISQLGHKLSELGELWPSIPKSKRRY